MAGLLLSATAWAQAPLEAYDAAIAADTAGGSLPVATLTSGITLTGGGGAAFNFGASSGDATIEFILEGNPSANNSAYLAVGATPVSSLRYEVWDNTGEMGFTQGGVADYQFSPGVPSVKKATHVAYVWDTFNTTMRIYLNGLLAGTCIGVDAAFVMPAGQGWLGAAENGAEGMVGKIHRVTAYDTALPEATVRRHAEAYSGQINQALSAYDAAITADAAGGLTPLAKLTTVVWLSGTGGAGFDFGASSGDVTMEFILEGDPSVNNSAFLAVGENSTSSLRYELWNNTGQMGFTQGGVADYSFSPGVSSPAQPTHIAYVWNAASLTMKLYVNGLLAGSAPNISPSFAMPMGPGRLGNNSGGTEPMVGTIYRVTVYDDIITDSAILHHAQVFIDVLRPPIIASFAATPSAIPVGGSSTLTWSVQNANQVLINGVDRTGTSQLSVSPIVSTAYTLTAVNPVGSTTRQMRVQVNPPLDAYDAAIAADAAGGLTPTAKLTTAVSRSGSGGAPFDFGNNSGDLTMEFILDGDPSANTGSYLAVGANPDSSLRYEAWENTGQIGFTQLGVADYLFTPPLPASSWPTHLTYVWNASDVTMKLYVNGTLAGTCKEVDGNFGMPTGQGWLGANPTGGEGMVGAIFRVTVYPGTLSDKMIHRHANAFLAAARPALNAYDTVIVASAATGLTPLARLLAPVAFTGANGVAFDFGATSDDASIEFILEGDPTANNSAFLAVGTNNLSSLRYEVWDNTGELGFTQSRVADYQFSPGVPSPTAITHVVYAWNAATSTMKAYVNGLVAGTTTGVDAAFGLPASVGWLGNNALAGTEPMVGTIHRVTVYDSLLTEDVILTHARAFTSAGQPPAVSLDLRGNLPAVILSQGISGLHYRVEYRNTLSATDSWQSLADIPMLSGTSARVEDPTPWAGRTQRYYRAVQVQSRFDCRRRLFPSSISRSPPLREIVSPSGPTELRILPRQSVSGRTAIGSSPAHGEPTN